MFLAREAFLLRRRHNFTVFDQCRRTVMVKRGNSDDAQLELQLFSRSSLKDRVNERCHRTALCEHNEATENRHEQ